MLDTLDASVGGETARFPANPVAVAIVKGCRRQGDYSKPAVFMSDTYDPIVPAGNQYEFFEEHG